MPFNARIFGLVLQRVFILNSDFATIYSLRLEIEQMPTP